MTARQAATPALLVLGPRGAGLAARLRELLPGALVHAPACAACPADVQFEKVVPHLQALFTAGQPIIGLCASGILIRAVAPLLSDKTREPPVLTVAEDGSAVVPLLGGHKGANELARRISGMLGVEPAITTASDLRLGVALDAPPPGWQPVERTPVRRVMAQLLEGAKVRLVTEDGLEASWLAELPQAADGAITVSVTVREDAPGDLVYRPRALVVGVGCERGVEADSLEELVRHTLAENCLSPEAIACVATIQLKAAEPAVHALARSLGVPARFFTADELLAETDRLSMRSKIVYRETGCWGVAEGAALAAVGPSGRLAVTKQRGRGVTCAVAMMAGPADPASVGRPQGKLVVVGLGPGGPRWRTAEAEQLLAEADELVGYGLYLDLVGPPGHGKPRHEFPLGAETERCRFALDRAAQGRSVALVCSGDPGIYALATLVFELLERADDLGWQRVAVSVSPGVSALQAAAARAGAPLGHDFCAISLSDLLTPAATIERRVEAAAAGDFVIALYNPVSMRRREALVRAQEILLQHRLPETPVVLARNLGREDESLRLVTLAELAPELCDMLTVVLVGSTSTRRVSQLHGPDWVYTPRGYDRKL